MLYELTMSPQLAPPLRIAEPPMRYRRRSRARNASIEEAHVPTEQIEFRVRARDNGARWNRILRLSERVSSGLRGDVRVAWLQLEESLHEHWLDVALEHYESGFESGFAVASELFDAENGLPSRDRLRLLAAALARIAAELED